MENSEQPIYPVPYQNDDRSIQHDVYTGLTKREYFAGLALQGMLANPQIPNMECTMCAKTSVRMADALLEHH